MRDIIENICGKRILITGRSSVVAQDLYEILVNKGYRKLMCVGSSDVDLTDQKSAYGYFEEYRPEIVFHIAAHTAGINDNAVKPWNILRDNLLMEANVCEGVARAKAAKLVWLSSDTALPRLGRSVSENDLFDCYVDRKRESYAFSKAMGIKMYEYLEQQENIRSISLLPCYIYGNTKKGYVFSVYKDIYRGKLQKKDKVTLWGKRDDRIKLIHSVDVASAMCYCMEHNMSDTRYLVGPQKGITKRELAEVISGIIGFCGKVEFDGRSTVAPPTFTESERLKAEGWNPDITLEEGVRRLHKFIMAGQSL